MKWLRTRRIAKDAARLAPRANALLEARNRIDAAVARGSLRGIRYWTDVWYAIHQVRLTNA